MFDYNCPKYCDIESEINKINKLITTLNKQDNYDAITEYNKLDTSKRANHWFMTEHRSHKREYKNSKTSKSMFKFNKKTEKINLKLEIKYQNNSTSKITAKYNITKKQKFMYEPRMASSKFIKKFEKENNVKWCDLDCSSKRSVNKMYFNKRK